MTELHENQTKATKAETYGGDTVSEGAKADTHAVKQDLTAWASWQGAQSASSAKRNL